MINISNWLALLIDGFTFYGGGGKGGGETQTSTSNNEPWSGVQPYITDYLKKAQTQSNTPFTFNSGDQIAPFSPEQQYGLGMTTQRAINGSPVMNAAQGNAYNTLQGNFMSPDSNPWLKQNVDTAMGDVQGRINSQFNNNNFGGSAHQENLTRDLGKVSGQMYGANYEQERARQMQTMGMAPQMAESDYRDAQALLGVGDARQQLSQSYLDQANGLFNQNKDYPQQQLDAYGRAVGVGMGAGGTNTTTSPNPNQRSGIADMIGTGLSVASLFGSGGIFSDERLKTNIVKVGTHSKGFGIYEYDKFGQRERGVMAQEVIKVMPEAVKEHESGYLMVNYGMIGY
jgi:hypothetical protein